MTRLFLLVVMSLCVCKAAYGAPVCGQYRPETVKDTLQADSASKRIGFWKRLRNYFRNSNRIDNTKKFDVGILGGPHFSSSKGFGIGLVGTGRYRQDRSDTLSQPSDVALFGDVTTKKSYTVGIRGTHIFPHDKGRIEYTLAANSFEENFWGIGYEMGDDDSNKSKIKRWKIQAKASFLWKVAKGLFFGPTVTYDYVNASEVERPELLAGMGTKNWNIGGGLTLAFDSRNSRTKPTEGFYLNITQLFRPEALSGGSDFIATGVSVDGYGTGFTTTDFRFNAYGKLWRRAVIAGDVRGTLNFGDPSWGMMSMIGNSFSMRGYYEGRYRDKHKLEAQVELRQDFWKRSGAVVWVGVGTVFDKFTAVRADRLLPNFGVGYRWEFKKNSNIRFDYGFGKKGISGFVFNINEAF